MIYSYNVVFQFILLTVYLCSTVSKFIIHNIYSYAVVYKKLNIVYLIFI